MLSPKERVVRALNHQVTDRVPIDFRATAETTDNLKKQLGINNENVLLERLGVDIRSVFPKDVGPELKKLADGSYEDIWGVIRKPVSYGLGHYNELCYYPLGTIKDVSEINEYNWPESDWWDHSQMEKEIMQINSNREYWIRTDPSGDNRGGIFEVAWAMRGMEPFLMDMVENSEIAFAILNKITEIHVQNITNTLEKVGNLIDMVCTYDDLGTQKGMMFSPETYRKFIKPCHAKLNRAIKKYNVKIMYHSCGSILPIIQDLIEIGVDILNPLQIRAKDMDPELLKERFGTRLCFNGGIDIQQILPFGTKEEVEKAVTKCINILGRNGGYIIGPAHAIQADTPCQNIVAMYDLAQNYKLVEMT